MRKTAPGWLSKIGKKVGGRPAIGKAGPVRNSLARDPSPALSFERDLFWALPY
jgi:hypothetical protein